MADNGYQRPPKPNYKASPQSSPESSSFAVLDPSYNDFSVAKDSIPKRIWQSFQRDPLAHTTPVGAVGANGDVFDTEGAAHATANTALARKLKGRHLQMIAIGGSIGK